MSPANPIRNKTDVSPETPDVTARLTFAKGERLHSKKSIEELFKTGSSLRFHPFFSKYIANTTGHNRLLIAVPKKFHRKAVTRNLLKRRIREAYRLNKELLAGYSLDIALIYQSPEVLAFEDIQQKLINLMVRLGKKAPPSRVEQKSKNFSANE